MKIKEQKNFPIEIHVSERRAKEGQLIIQSMICNYEKWKAGKELLRYRLGDHVSNNIKLVVDPSMLND